MLQSVKDFLHFAVVSVCKCIDQTGIRLILFVRNQQAIQTVSGHFWVVRENTVHTSDSNETGTCK